MQKPKFVDDIKDFLSFLAGLWGSLSGITLLFPLSNSLLKVIPVGASNLAIFTVIASIASVFALLLIYVGKDVLYMQDGKLLVEGKGRLIQDATIFFAIGFVSIPLYVIINAVSSAELASNQTFWNWAGWVVILILYVSIFLFFTGSFTILALAEYIRHLQPFTNRTRFSENGFLGIELGSRELEQTYLITNNYKRKISVSALLNDIQYQIETYARDNNYRINALTVTISNIEKIKEVEIDTVSIRIYILPEYRQEYINRIETLKEIAAKRMNNIELVIGEIDVKIVSSEKEIPQFT